VPNLNDTTRTQANPSRRALLAALPAASALALMGGHAPARAQDLATALLQPGPLEEKVLGDPDAPVTIIEYASMTCGHCARFHAETYPRLKEDYVDSGKVRIIMREFPLDALAAAAFMLARCVNDDAYFDFIDLLFERQREWAFSDKPVDALFAMGRQGGLTRADFDACLSNQELLNGVTAVRQRAEQEFGVSSTPTFFVNGELVRGAVSFDQFQSLIERHLSS